mmetsp:Transcript_20367/g.63859  ORF Transcript_20367/g.63859 Transcript_20367/m.63859 type:complete len:335 (-) Transcript_20367:1886-2890(-)
MPLVACVPSAAYLRAAAENWSARMGNRRPLDLTNERKSRIQHQAVTMRRSAGAFLQKEYKFRCAQGGRKSKPSLKLHDSAGSPSERMRTLLGTSRPKTTRTFVRLLAGYRVTTVCSERGGGPSNLRGGEPASLRLGAAGSVSLGTVASHPGLPQVRGPLQKQTSSQPQDDMTGSTRFSVFVTCTCCSTWSAPVSHSWSTRGGTSVSFLSASVDVLSRMPGSAMLSRMCLVAATRWCSGSAPGPTRRIVTGASCALPHGGRRDRLHLQSPPVPLQGGGPPVRGSGAASHQYRPHLLALRSPPTPHISTFGGGALKAGPKLVLESSNDSKVSLPRT